MKDIYTNKAHQRKNTKYSIQEDKFITTIKKNTAKYNVDNISRTKAYAAFYERNPEIMWSFLASMVSRNAGWNMTDLEGRWFKLALGWQERFAFFLTYELANWVIFRDAYPQLKIYELSLYYNKPCFHLLKAFHVSSFMEVEWELFWEKGDKQRLTTSLIINEQNLIQEPVLQNHALKRNVFGSGSYIFQDIGHFSSVVFPTLDGKLYGYSVHGFNKLKNRIKLGRKLASLLFHPSLYERFHQFSMNTEPTGSRYDYEQYFSVNLSRGTPMLRAIYPIVAHTPYECMEDWMVKRRKYLTSWRKPLTPKDKHYKELTEWFIHKQHQMDTLIALKKWL